MENDRLKELIEKFQGKMSDADKERVTTNFAEKLKSIRERQLNGNQNPTTLDKEKISQANKDAIERFKKMIAERSLNKQKK